MALADEAHMDVADFFGISSGNKMNDKFERTGYYAVKSITVRETELEVEFDTGIKVMSNKEQAA
ncbi:MAG: hypothetical protein IJ153_07220 [Clostridia bacterium]|nr:hypothetical protein [Clostridia bacterium]